MAEIRVTAGPFAFTARFERAKAPLTCARFASMLPYRERLIHVRWSGEACWIPLGGLDLGLGYENATSYPVLGQLLFHPGGISETEILLAYGSVRFGIKVGQLAGNHFLNIVEVAASLLDLGRLTLLQGAQLVEFAPVSSCALDLFILGKIAPPARARHAAIRRVKSARSNQCRNHHRHEPFSATRDHRRI